MYIWDTGSERVHCSPFSSPRRTGWPRRIRIRRTRQPGAPARFLRGSSGISGSSEYLDNPIKTWDLIAPSAAAEERSISRIIRPGTTHNPIGWFRSLSRTIASGTKYGRVARVGRGIVSGADGRQPGPDPRFVGSTPSERRRG